MPVAAQQAATDQQIRGTVRKSHIVQESRPRPHRSTNGCLELQNIKQAFGLSRLSARKGGRCPDLYRAAFGFAIWSATRGAVCRGGDGFSTFCLFCGSLLGRCSTVLQLQLVWCPHLHHREVLCAHTYHFITLADLTPKVAVSVFVARIRTSRPPVNLQGVSRGRIL